MSAISTNENAKVQGGMRNVEEARCPGNVHVLQVYDLQRHLAALLSVPPAGRCGQWLSLSELRTSCTARAAEVDAV